MNNLARQVFDLRTQLWQLTDNDQLPTPGNADRLAVVHQIDYHLHTVEGLLRTLGAPVHLHPAPEGAPDESEGAPPAVSAPALHPQTPEPPAPGAPDPQAHALAQEIRERGLSKQPAEVLARIFEAHSRGLSANRIARDIGLPHSTVDRALTAVSKAAGSDTLD